MRPLSKLLVAMLGFFVIQMPGSSGLAQSEQALKGVLADPEVQAHIRDAAHRSTVVINNACVSASFELTDTVIVCRPLTCDSTGAIDGGAWKQVVRCGTRRAKASHASMFRLLSNWSTCLIACLVTRPRPRASACPITATASDALVITPNVAPANASTLSA